MALLAHMIVATSVPMQVLSGDEVLVTTDQVLQKLEST
jgi:hypothetical protein